MVATITTYNKIIVDDSLFRKHGNRFIHKIAEGNKVSIPGVASFLLRLQQRRGPGYTRVSRLFTLPAYIPQHATYNQSFAKGNTAPVWGALRLLKPSGLSAGQYANYTAS
jgi:hypothetical protein